MGRLFTGFATLYGLAIAGLGIYRIWHPVPGITELGWTRPWAPGLCILILGMLGTCLGALVFWSQRDQK